MPKIQVYNAAITISASDWLSLHPTAGTYPLGAVGKLAMAVQSRNDMPGTFPVSKPKDGYLDAVAGHLDKLSTTQVGRDLIAALVATNRVVTIKPPSQTNMIMSRNSGVSISQTNANFADAYVALVRHMRMHNPVAARLELQGTMTAAAAMGYAEADLAAAVQNRLQSRNGQSCFNGVGGAAQAIAPRVVNLTAADITNMRNGPAALVDGQPLRYLALALERFLIRGPGTPVSIVFDPWAHGLGMLARPPHISLSHELLHALDAMRGTRIFNNEPEEECIYIGLGSWDTVACGGELRRFTENHLRIALGKPTRTLI